MLFRDRADAGRHLAARLRHYAGRGDLLVLALPRGGVPVGFEVAAALAAPLDAFPVRKLGVPGQEELAMGAIAPGGVRVLNDAVLQTVRPPPDAIERVAEAEGRELERQARAYRGDRPPVEVRDKTVVLVDDGLATGATMRAAVAAVRQLGPARVVVAVPVAAAGACAGLGADEAVFVYDPISFVSVGSWYGNFDATTDDEVRRLLARPPAKAFP